MRHYPANSPEDLARVVAIAMMADGAIDSSELKSLERHDIIQRIGLDQERFDQVFYEYYADLSISAHRLPSGQFELDDLTIGLLLDEIRDPQLQKKALRAMLDIVKREQKTGRLGLNAEQRELIAACVTTSASFWHQQPACLYRECVLAVHKLNTNIVTPRSPRRAG